MPKTEIRNEIYMDDECKVIEEMLSDGKTLTKTHESRDETEDRNQGLPIDRDWAW